MLLFPHHALVSHRSVLLEMLLYDILYVYWQTIALSDVAVLRLPHHALIPHRFVLLNLNSCSSMCWLGLIQTHYRYIGKPSR